MDKVKAPSSRLEGLEPYDPKYLPARLYLSANENPQDVPKEIRAKIERAISEVNFNRYPDPCANELRDMIAEASGLTREWVLVGNGGDELLFDTALAWGGVGRRFLNLPPTFSVYATNAYLTNTEVIDVERLSDSEWAIDEERVLELARQDAFDFTIISSPNNPTGKMAREEFLSELLSSTDALIMVDEAYFEFSRFTMRHYLEKNENLVILRTFSKAFSLAGVRLGYIFANPYVIQQYMKVRQPYSVDAVSQAIGKVVFENRSAFEPGIESIISERARVMEGLKKIPGIKPYESDSNWVLFKIPDASLAWQYLYDNGVLVRDFSNAGPIAGTLRVSIGSKAQNDEFLKRTRDFVMRKDS